MSSRNSESGFLHKLAWTVVLALVFSAGLITGQRLIRSESQPPLVSVSSKAAEPPPASDSPENRETSRPLFSFYDQLSQGIDSSSPSDDERRDPARDDESAATDEPSDSDADADPSASPSSEASEEAPTDEESGEVVDEADDGADTTDDSAATTAETSAESDRSESDSNDVEDGATKYTLQVSAYPSLERARSRVESLTNKGLDAHVVSANVPDKGTYYRVRIGEFRSMDAAQKFQEELTRKRGVETFVTPL